MNENSSQTIKELSENNEIKNSSELDNDSISQNDADLSFEKNDIPSADSSSSRVNTDFDNAGFTQEEFASLLGKYDYNFKPGDLVKGTVFALEPKGAMIDIGAKTAAFMPVQEVSINKVEGLNEVLQPSESREFFIMSEENERSISTFNQKNWIPKSMGKSKTIAKRGCNYLFWSFCDKQRWSLSEREGLRGFIPGSHISARKIKDDLEGEDLPCKVSWSWWRKKQISIKHRRALVEKMNRLEVGEVVVGSVKGIKPYGAFIDIGGVSGLLHISEISHEHIETPHILNVNDQMKVMIIDLIRKRKNFIIYESTWTWTRRYAYRPSKSFCQSRRNGS